MSGPLVVGMDVGGTTTRAVVATPTGRVLGVGRAGCGNPVSGGGEAAAGAVGQALRAALAGVDPSRVTAAVIGLAGGCLTTTDPAIATAMADAWLLAGVRCRPVPVGDAVLAYVSGTREPDGTVLVCGTGAVAAEFRDGAPVRIADGHGWLFGDRGSGFWIGREAVSAVLDAVDRAGVLPPLGARLLDELGVPSPARGTPAQDVVAAVVDRVYRLAPAAIAGLAPAVLAAAADRDPLAAPIARRAAAHLVDTVTAVRRLRARTPVVLGGSVLASPLVGEAVRADLGRLWPDAPVLPAGDGARAAAWLALVELGVLRELGEPAADAAYDRLIDDLGREPVEDLSGGGLTQPGRSPSSCDVA